MIKNALRSLALSTTILFAIQPAFADQRDFRVFNKTSVDIKHLYVSPSGAKSWEEDVLGRDTLSSGDSTKIYFQGNAATCRYDIRAEFDDGDVVEDYKINLCTTGSYTFREGK
ncbi:hypothetical protein Syn7502_03101 [Synechococcus sp. PCC 7502]|uniref:hypothetical protein n=1 Tax=Synechococcus sp. PCC 7502 TaxID=1173263 RepID=UPI00029F9CFF|nr:hypothetical protein [Synechococcus sp. PCC 7502]AFY74999.1 hypothetical protein Syn7502_03101 [Synechococcus sp. PCC 7502]